MYTTSPHFIKTTNLPTKDMAPMMHAQHHMINHATFTIEVLYAGLIIAICAIIYAKTRELYTLSGHEGIKHFKNTFFYFALAYLFRITPLILQTLDIYPRGLRIGYLTTYLLFAYASSMAILSIMRSVSHKKLPKGILQLDSTYQLIAILLATIVMLLGSPLIFFTTQASLIIAAFIITKTHHNKKTSTTYITYLLLLLFWLLNIAITITPRFLQTTTYTLYTLSTILFIIILVKVIGRTK